jgi:hypothetical protein
VGDFKGGATNTILHRKSRKPKEKSQIFKKFTDGARQFEFEKAIKLINTVMPKIFLVIWGGHPFWS